MASVMALAGCSSSPHHARPADAGLLVDAARSFFDDEIGSVVTSTDSPPPLSGGTLLVTHDDRFAVASDPERDRVVVTDLGVHVVLAAIGLSVRDEPGRLAEDAAGRVHVVLRGGGAIATIDPAVGVVTARRSVCAAPRGIAYDAAHDTLHVACRDGELVTLSPTGDTPTRVLTLDDDLRDVVVSNDLLYVSRFRSADVLVIDASGVVAERISLASAPQPTTDSNEAPEVAWRLVATPDGVLLLHQRARTRPIDLAAPSPYGGTSNSCDTDGSVVSTAVTPLSAGVAPPASSRVPCVVLGVDIAVMPGGDRFAIAAPGSAPFLTDLEITSYPLHVPPGEALVRYPEQFFIAPSPPPAMRAVALAYLHDGTLVAQTREPSGLVLFGAGDPRSIVFGGPSRDDTGFTLFHSSPSSLTCASCHPEGGEDGHTWTFGRIGARRTQSLRGGILGTAPFHWDGAESDFSVLVNDVLAHRMGGGTITSPHTSALAQWVDTVRAPVAQAVADAASVARGRALFEDSTIGCASCHVGAAMTNDQTVDVGTGGAFQVPSLRGVFARAPYMHDGCAGTLRARFDDPTCGGGDRHGTTTQLTTGQVDDLVAYLETL